MKKLNINTNGNKKLRNTENVRFMIWNLPAVKTCPFATEMCKTSCYARKAERVYPTVLPSREQNYNDSLSVNFVYNMIHSIEKLLNGKAYNGKKAIFRIHESGDFYSLDYVRKWVQICKHFENDSRIEFVAYTKSITYFISLGYGKTCPPYNPKTAFPTNLHILSSIWNDTPHRLFDLTITHSFPIYTAMTTEQIDTAENVTVCRCDDCATCGKCWDKSEKCIACKIH